ncbi:hypothetical protein [Deinococcus marmoris]|uniref:hypothetical protein n=1 Tax=Deinococcus marmoris TaxID=249408 RepID=UPI000497463C|nr:hypothetical protein [Deinococcus marmoris]
MTDTSGPGLDRVLVRRCLRETHQRRGLALVPSLQLADRLNSKNNRIRPGLLVLILIGLLFNARFSPQHARAFLMLFDGRLLF